MEGKDEDELALDDKLDIVRTIVRLRKRVEGRHELNDLEAQIKQAHKEEVNSGSVTQGLVPDNSSLLSLFASKAVGAIEENSSDGKPGDEDNK